MGSGAGAELVGPPFIVDNGSDAASVRTALSELLEGCEAFDVATGYFEIGALLALGDAWKGVGRIRILIGSETPRQTAVALREAKEGVDRSVIAERRKDPFLAPLDEIVEALRSGQIQVKVYAKPKFHAKAYLARRGPSEGVALVGSSNFTRPGLERNIELNIRPDDDRFDELSGWFEKHWQEADEAVPDILEVLERHRRPYSPFHVYARALQQLTADVDPSVLEWEQNHSRIYKLLAPYQQEGYRGLRQRAEKHGGAFLTDGVGLGKTFVGMMLAEYFAEKEGLNVLIMATKTGVDAVWKPTIERYMPELTGEFTRIRVMAHTDLSKQNAMETVRRLHERVQVVIIDEGHNFRNRGPAGTDLENPRARWRRMQLLCEGKKVFHLTATPINNGLFDLVHEFELFTGLTGSGEMGDRHFAQTLGIPSVQTYVRNLESTFLKAVASDEKSQIEADSITMADFERLLQQDRLLGELIVQHSRQYAKKSAEATRRSDVRFPDPALPRAVPYQYDAPSRRLLEDLEAAFRKENPLFTLPMYFPLAFSKNPDVDQIVENRQKQVVGLIRTVFLKRFESSIASFTGSCLDLADKVAGWIAANSSDIPEVRARLHAWRAQHDPLFAAARAAFRPEEIPDDGEPLAPEDDDNDAELLSDLAEGDVVEDEFDLDAMFEASFEDLHQLGQFIDRAVMVSQTADVKFDRLAILLGAKKDNTADPVVFDPAFRTHKVLVFTEFADTARYLERRLVELDLEHVDRLDGSRKKSRLEMIHRFAPFYNDVPAPQRAEQKPLRVLVSTDVLSEGVNLQDGTLIVNYDIHWNPVRLMQRIGRIDRRMNNAIEAELVAADPSTGPLRGTIQIRNFLAPDELDTLLRLARRVTHRSLLISKTLGIPGGRLLTEEDMLDDVRVFGAFLEDFYGDMSPEEVLRVKYQDLIAEHPDLVDQLVAMPDGAYAAKQGGPAGTFVCARDPGPETDEAGKVLRWTVDAGRPRWSLLTADGQVIEDLLEIDAAIACDPGEPTTAVDDRSATARRLRELSQGHKQLMHKRVQLPLDAEDPRTICWMEVTA